MAEMKSLTLNDKTYDSFVDRTAREMAAASFVVKSASGEIITASDTGDRKLFGLSIYGKTTQDGTPTPDAPAELVSIGDSGSFGVMVAGGKNLLTKPFLIGVHSPSGYNSLNDKVISTRGFGLKAGTYVISGAINNSWSLYINGMTSATTTSEYQKHYMGRVFTVPEDGLYNIQFNRSDGNAFTDAEIQALNRSAQVEYGEVATEYEPYRGQNLVVETPNGLPGIPVTSGGNYTDANGQQWICDEIDFARGVYVRRVDSREITQDALFTLASYGNAGYYRIVISDVDTAIGNQVPCMCSHFECKYEWEQDREYTYVTGDGSSKAYLFSNRWTSASAFTTWLQEQKNNGTPLTYVYRRGEYAETPLSAEELTAYAALHTYKDHTTVSNDAGAWMDLEYVMDAKKYIDSMISASGIIPATVE